MSESKPGGQAMNERPAKNTDRELWREREGDFYADSIHVTEGGGIGINCGGHVIVKPLREWHKLAAAPISVEAEGLAREIHAPNCVYCRLKGATATGCLGEINRVATLLRPHLERAEPFGWWDEFNGCIHRSEKDAKLAADGGNTVFPLYRLPAAPDTEKKA